MSFWDQANGLAEGGSPKPVASARTQTVKKVDHMAHAPEEVWADQGSPASLRR
jgi:hypothetical protein